MATGSESSTRSDEPGLLGRLPHPDLLTFFSLAQNCQSNLLEYSPRYDDEDRRRGGNAAVQVVYLSKLSRNASRLPSFAFKRHDLVRGLSHKARIKKIISELMIYESAIIRRHPNIAKLEGISWSVTSASTETSNAPSITPVLGFEPSDCGTLVTYFELCGQDLSLTRRLKICCDIGHGLETLYSLNIAHGDLKPENVLVKGFVNPVAQLIDFDGSSFGLTGSDQVWVSGTKGWTDPELTRGNRTVELWEAFKADLYSFGKLCAWVVFRRILDIDDNIKDTGRTSVQQYEFFDLKGAIDNVRLMDSGGAGSPFKPSELQVVESMHEFFSMMLIGCRERRCVNISQGVKLLERILLSAKAADVANDSNRRLGLIEKMKQKASLCQHKLGLTTRPYNHSRYEITQAFLTRAFRIKHDLAGRPRDQGHTFAEKQWIYRSALQMPGPRDIISGLHVLLAGCLGLVMIVCALYFFEETVRHGQICKQGPEVMCWAGAGSAMILGPYLCMVLVYVVGSIIKFSCSQVQRWQRPELYSGNTIEMTEDNIRQIGSQVAHSEERPSFLKELAGKLVVDDMDTIAPWRIVTPGHHFLPQLGDGGNSCHLLPKLIPLTPLLCRLHYNVRCQLVNDLRQRFTCSLCHEQAKRMLHTCDLLGIGGARTSDNFPQKPALLRHTLKHHLHADLEYWSSLPQLPFEVRNRIQEGRADLYTFDEIPGAIHSIMTEVLAKIDTGTCCRSTQVLCGALGRLFALLGRHEEAALCFYTSLTHRSKPRWRTYDNLALRMNDWIRSPDGHMEVRRERDQLIEAEHDLFLFSLVHEYTILGQSQEAIQELQAVRDIGVAPNGLYLERETGRSFKYIEHRVTDARNLLKVILLDNGMLEELEEMKHEYDMADTIKYLNYGQDPTPDQAFQCFLTTERVALLLYERGRFNDAVQIQRLLLKFCSMNLIHRDSADIQLLRQALALSLSRCESAVHIDEALRIQEELMAQTQTLGESREPRFSLRLSLVNTLAKLGHLGADCNAIRCLFENDREWKIVVLKSPEFGRSQSGASFLWLCEIPDGLRSAPIIQHALLATCIHLEGGAQLQLITLLCANPSTAGLLDNFEEIIGFLEDATLKSNASVPFHLMLWDRLVCLLIYIGTVMEQREKFDLAEQTINEMTNYVSILSEDHEDEIRAAHLRNLVSCAKAQYLNTHGFGAGDSDFWNEALKAHDMARQKRPNSGKGPMKLDLLSKMSFAAMLKEKVIAFDDRAEADQLLDLYEDIDTRQDDLLAIHVEQAHINSVLNRDNYPQEEDPLCSALINCQTTLGPSHALTNQIRTRIAYSLEQRGQFSEACDLLKDVAERVQTTFGSTHPQTLRARFNLTKLQSTRGVQLGLHAYSYLPTLSDLRYSATQVLGKEHPSTQVYLGAYALALERDERAVKEAISTKKEVVKALGEILGVDHTRTIQEQSELGGMLCRRGGKAHSEGRIRFECSVRSAVTLYGVSHPRTRALWKECVAAITTSIFGDELTPSPRQTTLSAKAISEQAHNDYHDEVGRALDPRAREILLSRLLLGADHPLTLEMQQRLGSPPQQCAWIERSNEEIAAIYFPIPPVKQLKEQWSEFLEPLLKIYEKQRVYGLRERRKALALGKENFQGSGGVRFVHLRP